MQKFIARERFEFSNGAVGWAPDGPFDCLGPYAKVENCPIMESGHEIARRTCYATGYADTFFSVPAVCRYRGQRVTGYFTRCEGEIEFHAHSPEYHASKAREKTIATMRREVRALLIELKKEIGDEYRAPGCEDETSPSMQVTIGSDSELSDWNYQTGDNSYTGGAYGFPFWGVVTLDRRSNCADLTADAVSQILDQIGE